MEKLYNVLLSLGVKVYYVVADKNATLPFIAYNDYSEYYRKGDNRIDDVVQNVQVDYYTNTQRDKNKNKLRKALDDAGFTFSYSMLYDSTERVYHHIFDCEVMEDGNITTSNTTN
jgi:hypothetical protein